VRQNFYTERVINLWNSLPATVSFTSLSSFRRTICNDDFLVLCIISFIISMLFMGECQSLTTFSSSSLLSLFEQINFNLIYN